MRSIRYRLALGFLLTTLAAVVVVYFYVVPPLESRLRDQKLSTLAISAQAYSTPLLKAIGTKVDEAQIDREVRQAADSSGARVTLFGVSRGTLGLRTYPISDSTAEVDISDLSFDVALEAASGRRVVTGTEAAAKGRVAEAARPMLFKGRVARVVVYSQPLSDVTDNVALVRRRVLIAGGLGLLVALLAGLLIARALARRIARLERGARRVAAGDFSARFPVDARDELGQLAGALDNMQRQLAQLDSARKHFIATASHELRTPIFSLSGFVELLLDEDLDEETRRTFLEQIREQVERLRRLTVDLLDLSKLEAGSLELRPQPTDLGLVARAVTDEFLPALTAHRSHLELRLPGGPIQAVCDPERVAQVLRILIDNAIVHTPEATKIIITASRANGHASLSVRDFGPGIRRTSMDRIFEPFFTSDDAQGSGLGLAIAHELAERMQGKLTVEPTPGRTTFTFELPA